MTLYLLYSSPLELIHRKSNPALFIPLLKIRWQSITDMIRDFYFKDVTKRVLKDSCILSKRRNKKREIRKKFKWSIIHWNCYLKALLDFLICFYQLGYCSSHYRFQVHQKLDKKSIQEEKTKAKTWKNEKLGQAACKNIVKSASQRRSASDSREWGDFVCRYTAKAGSVRRQSLISTLRSPCHNKCTRSCAFVVV